MTLRKTVSLLLLLTFVLLILTSVVLFIAPEGRVAYWSDWRLLGLPKTAWSDLHVNLGFLFLVAGVVHVFLNWRPLVSYLRDRLRRLRVVTPDFVAAALLTVAFAGLTLAEAKPIRWFQDLRGFFAASTAERYGDPPYGHAELSSVADFASKTGLDAAAAVSAMRVSGLEVSSDRETILEIARRHAITPREVHERMLGGGPPPVPVDPPTGIGNSTVPEICARFGIDAARAEAAFAARGLACAPEKPLKRLAEEAGVSPVDLWALLRETAASK